MKLVYKEGGDFKIAPAGNHRAVCNAVIDLGNQQTNFGVKNQVYIRFELTDERLSYEKDGEKKEGPMSIGNTYNVFFNEKSNLYKMLVSWRGKAFSDEELKGFELFNIVGTACMLNVVHKESGGKTYANIASVTPLPKAMEKPDPENPLIKYDEENESDWDLLPEWLQTKIKSQIGEEKLVRGEVHSNTKDFDDDIPF
jgi:hypothetical protein